MHFYFDLDGVLAIFDETISELKPFNVPGYHYFRTCRPDMKAIGIAKHITENTRHTVSILSRIWDNTEMDEEWRVDKTEWSTEHCPFIHDVNIFVNNSRSKTPFLMKACPNTSLRGNHILIDDDPVILSLWRSAGGTGIQYIQPEHHVRTWDGNVILPEMRTNAAITLLESHMR